MSSGVSVWWPTPARPDQHFSSQELTASAAYHRPLRRAGAAGVAGKVVLLILAGWLAAWSAGNPGPALDEGFLPILASKPLLIGAALTTAALRLPSVAVDAWFEYGFRHGDRFGLAGDSFTPAPVRWFAVTVAAISVGIWAAMVILGAFGYWLIGTSGGWAITLSLAGLGILAGVALVERPIRQALPGGERRLADQPFTALASAFGLPGLPLSVSSASPATGVHRETSDTAAPGRPASAGETVNACAVGVGPNRRVVVTDALLGEDARLRDHVVAHELTHLARHHLLIQSVVAAVAFAGTVQLVSVAIRSRWPWNWFGLEAADPSGMPIVALLLFLISGALAPAVAWVARVQERAADVGAVAMLGSLPPDLAYRLHGQNSADLDPPWWVRLYDRHPTPAERLEFLARHRRVRHRSSESIKQP